MKHWLTPKQTVATSKNFSDSNPTGIRVTQMNQQIQDGNARIQSFPGPTFHHLLHYLDVNLDK